ncbi:MAG TPA: hypothetical protein VFY58_08380, partial [Nocardioides sp.]|nr:hypothetical protein [Nocardioides sp.]
MGAHRASRRGLRRASSVNPVKRSETPLTLTLDRAAHQDGTAGRRRAAKHSGRRGRLIPGLPPLPLVVGVAALAISAGGAISVANPELISGETRVAGASALNGTSAAASANLLKEREAVVSRDSRRDALEDAADEKLVEQAEQQAQERNAALAKFAKQAEAQAAKIALNQWV